jgi:hypothetical protein
VNRTDEKHLSTLTSTIARYVVSGGGASVLHARTRIKGLLQDVVVEVVTIGDE